MVLEKVGNGADGCSCRPIGAYITSHIPAKPSCAIAPPRVVLWACQLSRHKDYAFFQADVNNMDIHNCITSNQQTPHSIFSVQHNVIGRHRVHDELNVESTCCIFTTYIIEMNQEMSHDDLSDADNFSITTNIDTIRIHLSLLLSYRTIYTLWC